MLITIERSIYKAEGWTPMAPLTLDGAPELAYEYARTRGDGPIAPTRDEIREACREAYTVRRSGTGTLTHGDIAVERVRVED